MQACEQKITPEATTHYWKAKSYEFLAYSNFSNTPHVLDDPSQIQNQRNAIWNYLNAALKSHTEAQYKLGLIYLNGTLGTDRNYQIADQWLYKAKLNGHSDAARVLAHAYSQLAI